MKRKARTAIAGLTLGTGLVFAASTSLLVDGSTPELKGGVDHQPLESAGRVGSQTQTSAPPPAPVANPGSPTVSPPSKPTTNKPGTTPQVGDISDAGRNYRIADFLRTGVPIPPSTAHEPTGSFRFVCEFSHLAYDDPIVYPGQSGVSHLHMFFGNTKADANSTYDSLRTTGDSTCQGGPINRSAYWAPALIDTAGKAVIPDVITVYYKGRGYGTDASRVDVAEMPPGLRMIAGADPMDPSSATRHSWYCEGGSTKTRTIPTCPSGEKVGVHMAFPTCWDGRTLDAPDHRSHVTYPVRNGQTGMLACPTSHPVSIPEFSLGIWFTHKGDSANWHLTSDRMQGGPQNANGASFHSDWFGGWDTEVLRTWTSTCINGQLNCSFGDLGNGTALSVMADYTGSTRVDPPR